MNPQGLHTWWICPELLKLREVNIRQRRVLVCDLWCATGMIHYYLSLMLGQSITADLLLLYRRKTLETDLNVSLPGEKKRRIVVSPKPLSKRHSIRKLTRFRDLSPFSCISFAGPLTYRCSLIKHLDLFWSEGLPQECLLRVHILKKLLIFHRRNQYRATKSIGVLIGG